MEEEQKALQRRLQHACVGPDPSDILHRTICPRLFSFLGTCHGGASSALSLLSLPCIYAIQHQEKR